MGLEFMAFTACRVHRHSGLWQVEEVLRQWFRCWLLAVSLVCWNGQSWRYTDRTLMASVHVMTMRPLDEGGHDVSLWEMKCKCRWLDVGTSLSGRKGTMSLPTCTHFIRQSWTYSSFGQWVVYFPTSFLCTQDPLSSPGWVLCTSSCSLDLRLQRSLFQTSFPECCACLIQQAWSEMIYSLLPAGSLSSYDSTVTHT